MNENIRAEVNASYEKLVSLVKKLHPDFEFVVSVSVIGIPPEEESVDVLCATNIMDLKEFFTFCDVLSSIYTSNDVDVQYYDEEDSPDSDDDSPIANIPDLFD